jgi:hypothetical protein
MSALFEMPGGPPANETGGETDGRLLTGLVIHP